MNCTHARLLLGADPHSAAPELTEHLGSCPACVTFRDEMLQLDGRIARALERPPDLAPARQPARAAPWRQWALAASVLLASALFLGVWLLRPTDTLAHELVTHVQNEPESWLAANEVDAEGIGKALQGGRVALELTSDRITYAQSCWFRGHYVPHLVVQTAQGPATVLILRHVQVPGVRTFNEDGLNGIIVPAEKGSIAVLARGGDVQPIARQMQQEVRWLPDP